MRRSFKIFALSALLITGCDEDQLENFQQGQMRIILEGRPIDTAYLFTVYKDPGASFFEYRDGRKNCTDYGLVSDITGSVNTNLPGTYYLTYNANDTSGKPLTPITRTVVVVENKTGFLNGFYNVACTCTAIARSEKPVVTTQNYTAVVNPSSNKDHFELISLEVGGEKVVNTPCLVGDKLEISGFYNANFDWSSSGGSGTVAPSGNSFTIETQAQRFTPTVRYYCTNVFTKFLTIRSSEPDNRN